MAARGSENMAARGSENMLLRQLRLCARALRSYTPSAQLLVGPGLNTPDYLIAQPLAPARALPAQIPYDRRGTAGAHRGLIWALFSTSPVRPSPRLRCFSASRSGSVCRRSVPAAAGYRRSRHPARHRRAASMACPSPRLHWQAADADIGLFLCPAHRYRCTSSSGETATSVARRAQTRGPAARTSSSTWFSNVLKFSRNMPARVCAWVS